MLTSTALSRGSSASDTNRVFVYEVSGLAENDRTNNHIQPIRASSNCFYQVPFAKMNQTMRQITRLGGTIVSIQSMEQFNATQSAPAPATNEENQES